jgi:4-diphosphocytidyl-2-C-methyl-D-erythritol kinase
VSDVPGRTVAIDAPAKLNLGLEIVGRRPDGYHELATIFLAIDLSDRLTLAETDDLVLICDELPLASDGNLALAAISALRDATSYPGGAQIDLIKRIPAAAGLGGASSDAAAALLAARDLWQVTVPAGRLAALAAQLGSDVAFFLRGGCALGRGRGELLDALPMPTGIWFVLVVPDVTIPRKTASLFASLQPPDFSDGSRIEAQAARLRSGLPLDPALLANAFARPLYARFPALGELPAVMRDCGATTVAISGAGPAHYAVTHDREEAERLAYRLRDRLRDRAVIFVVRPDRESTHHNERR